MLLALRIHETTIYTAQTKVRPPKSDPLNQTPKTSSETSLTVEYKSYNML